MKYLIKNKIFKFANKKSMKDFLKYIYSNIDQELKYVESKYSILITLASALTVFSATYLNNFSPLVTSLSAISIVFSLISVIYGFLGISNRSLRVKINNKKHKIKNSNLLNYKNIIALDEKEFIKKINKIYLHEKGNKIEQFDIDITQQIIIKSKQINQKYILFNFSIIFLFLSLFCECLSIFLLGMGINI